MTRPRIGTRIVTFTGREFWPLDPDSAEVDILDIAHHLSQLCRFTGATRKFYSVAEHSLRVAAALDLLDPEIQLAGLLHDASEAYLIDLPTPLKEHAPWYREWERVVQLAIWKAFDVRVPYNLPAIKAADEIMFATEARDLMAVPPTPWIVREAPMPTKITPMPAEEAKTRFLARFESLQKLRHSSLSGDLT